MILIIGGSGSGKTNSLFNLTSQQPDINKIYLYAKDPYQFLIDKRESTELKYLNHSKAFIECSNDMDDICKKLKDATQTRKATY